MRAHEAPPEGEQMVKTEAARLIGLAMDGATVRDDKLADAAAAYGMTLADVSRFRLAALRVTSPQRESLLESDEDMIRLHGLDSDVEYDGEAA